MSKATPKEEPVWWLKPLAVAEPKAELATDAAGLSNAEAGSRLAKFGPNLFRDHQERPLFVQFLAPASRIFWSYSSWLPVRFPRLPAK